MHALHVLQRWCVACVVIEATTNFCTQRVAGHMSVSADPFSKLLPSMGLSRALLGSRKNGGSDGGKNGHGKVGTQPPMQNDAFACQPVATAAIFTSKVH